MRESAGAMTRSPADRTEQRLGESAVSAAAHHQEISIVGGIEQHLRGNSLDGEAAHPDRAARVGGVADRVSDDLLRVFAEAEVPSMPAGPQP